MIKESKAFLAERKNASIFRRNKGFYKQIKLCALCLRAFNTVRKLNISRNSVGPT